jgi:short-subunit dehydrogenase
MSKKVVIITGASSGIGKALAFEFAKLDYRIVIAARNSANLEEVKSELIKLNCEVISVIADVAKEEDCKLIINAAIEKYNQIDVLINNAGISMRAIFEDLDLSVLKKLMDTNFWGTVYCTKLALPWLLKSKGSVVAVSSIAGFAPLPGRTGYSSSKFAIHGFLQTLRIENMKKGLHVMIAAPGFTESNIRKTALVADGSQQGETPRAEEKLMSAEKVAFFIAKGIEKRKRTIVLTSEGKMVVLLYKLFPSFMDKVIYKSMAKEPDSPLK